MVVYVCNRVAGDDDEGVLWCIAADNCDEVVVDVVVDAGMDILLHLQSCMCVCAFVWVCLISAAHDDNHSVHSVYFILSPQL